MARKFKRRIALKRKIRRQKRLPVVFFPSVARDVISSHKAANERPEPNIGDEDYFGNEPHFSLRDILWKEV